MTLRLAFKNVFRSKARSSITLGAIALGCIAVTTAGGFIEDCVSQSTEEYVRAFLGHVQVARGGYYERGAAEPFGLMIRDPEEVLRLARSDGRVLGAAPRIEFAGLLSKGEVSLPFMAQAVAPGEEINEHVTFTSGGDLRAADAFEVVLGTGLAGAVGARVGDSVVLLTATAGGGLNGADAVVKGIFATASKEYDDHALRLPLKTAQRLLRTDSVHTVTLFLRKTADTDAVRDSLDRALRGKGLDLEARPWYRMAGADFVLKMVGFFKGLFDVFRLIIVLIVVLSIFNTMNMAVLERIGEIGTMMALGAGRRGVLALFLAEGLILGCLGGLLGLAGGYVLAEAVSWFGIPMPTPPGTTTPWTARIAVVPGVFASAFLLALATSFISSLYPAWKASRLEIADALRRNV